jgi:hypothetical protein
MVRLDGANGVNFRVKISKQGSTNLYDSPNSIQGDPWASYYTLSAAGTLFLNAEEYVSVSIWGDSDTSWTVNTESGFSGHLLQQHGSGTVAYFRGSKGGSQPLETPWRTLVRNWNDKGNVGGSGTDQMTGFSVVLTGARAVSQTGWTEVTGWRNWGGLFKKGSFNPTTGRFSATSSGYYHVACNIRLDRANGNYFRVIIAVDGSTSANGGLHSIRGKSNEAYYTLNVR